MKSSIETKDFYKKGKVIDDLKVVDDASKTLDSKNCRIQDFSVLDPHGYIKKKQREREAAHSQMSIQPKRKEDPRFNSVELPTVLQPSNMRRYDSTLEITNRQSPQRVVY